MNAITRTLLVAAPVAALVAAATLAVDAGDAAPRAARLAASHDDVRSEPAPVASEATVEDEGPGTATTAAPVYGENAPSSWTITVPKATVYGVPGDTSTKTGEITDARADIAGTGRVATVGITEWFEVKVPGATTGWVVGTELERL